MLISHKYLQSNCNTTHQYLNLYLNWKKKTKKHKTYIPILFPNREDTGLKQAGTSSQFHQSISYPGEKKGGEYSNTEKTPLPNSRYQFNNLPYL